MFVCSGIIAETFGSLKHFGHLSQSCIRTRHKCFLVYIFEHSYRNDIIFFGRFKNVSVCDRKKNRCTVVSEFTITHVWTWDHSLLLDYIVI